MIMNSFVRHEIMDIEGISRELVSVAEGLSELRKDDVN
jgi:hypothetical protein